MDKKIKQLNVNNNKERFNEAMHIPRERYDEITRTVFDVFKEDTNDENIKKTDTINRIIKELNGVTPEELLMCGLAIGGLEYMKRSQVDLEELTDMDKSKGLQGLLKKKTPEDIAVLAINKEAFVSDMKNGEHDF